MEESVKTDVLIIGAGPTGLSLACQLIRYGVDFVMIEKNESITPDSKAIGVQARTLEIYDQLGLAQRAIDQGSIGTKALLLTDGKIRGEIDFTNIGRGSSPFPFVLILEQSKNEKLLYEYLQNHKKEVQWKTELEHFSQTEAGVTAKIKNGNNGQSQTIEAKYLVGCDGPKSLVRHVLGLPFEGSTFERMFYVADAKIDWSFSHDALHICLSTNSFVIFFPLKGERRYRIVGVFPQEFTKDEGEVLYEEIEGRVKNVSKLKMNIHDVEWFSTYKVHTRHASKFSEGRCFLAGDAAHIHSPAGAQGMNTGIQDAYNLAWKLALAIKEGFTHNLLDTYSAERLENAKHLLKTTDRVFEFGAGPEWYLIFLRMKVLPKVAKFLLSLKAVKNYVFPLISEIGIKYPLSELSRHDGDRNFKVKAGDRMPYFMIEGKSVYDKLSQPKFHLLLFSNSTLESQTLKSELGGQFEAIIDLSSLPLSGEVVKSFGANIPFCVLLRPDNHIGFISAEIKPDVLKNYFDRFIRNT
jgi:2-polyprenyl-6-methoxyphenol hydroxylase-like FAD-dependent oxidoreductase